MFAERRYQLSQSQNKELFSSVYQALLMCKMVDPYISRYAQVACAEAINVFTEKTAIEVVRAK